MLLPTKKEVVCAWGITTDSKYFNEVVELTRAGECAFEYATTDIHTHGCLLLR
jgi:hypothetical protein